MATIRERVRNDGSRSFAVLFRHHGRQASRTFEDRAGAEHFVKVIDVLGLDAALAMAAAPPDALTLDALAERFFDYKATRVRSDRTVADYRRDYRNHIGPVLGSRPVASINEGDVQRLVDAMSAELSPKSVADRHAILAGIFKWAAAPSRLLVENNPCIGTELPRRAKTQPKGLRPAEWQALHGALERINPDAANLAFFLLATGWRWSEAAALSAYDVEDDGTNVHVTMGRVLRRNAAGQHVIVEEAKSAAGLRRIRLDNEAAAMVRRRLESVRGDGLVFTTATGVQWHYGNFLRRAWKPAIEAAGLTRSPGPHALRHTHVVWMAMTNKASLPELQRRIGHESIATTINVYGRMIEDVSGEALDAFAAIRSTDPLRAVTQS